MVQELAGGYMSQQNYDADGRPGAAPVVEAIDPEGPGTSVSDMGPGWVPLYRMDNGEKIWVLRPLRDNVLRKRYDRVTASDRPDLIGKPVFSITPIAAPFLGQSRCPLFPGVEQCAKCGEAHAPSAEWATYQTMGLPRCLSAHLASEYEAQRHLRIFHPTANTVIQDRKAELRRVEDRELQQETLKALTANIGRQRGRE